VDRRGRIAKTTPVSVVAEACRTQNATQNSWRLCLHAAAPRLWNNLLVDVICLFTKIISCFCQVTRSSAVKRCSSILNAHHTIVKMVRIYKLQHFYRATLCVCCRPVSARPYFCSSNTLVYCFHTAEDIVKLITRPGSPIILFFDTSTCTQFKGIPFSGAHNRRRWENFAIFD